MSGLQAAFDAALGDRAAALHAMHCRVVLIDTADWLPWLDDAEALLDAAERQRVLRQRRSDERQTRAIAYALHRLLLSATLGRAPGDVPLIRDPLGSPRLSDGSLVTSLSHAANYVALAIAPTACGAVGVDIEPWSRATSMEDIANHVCHPEEARLLAGLDAISRARALLTLWVCKEALLKSAGVGLGREMTGFVAPTDVPLAPLEGAPATTLIRFVDAGPHCCAAVAVGAGVAVHAGWLRPG